MPEPWYKDGLRFECKNGCGRCCTGPADAPGHVFLERGEAARLAGHLGLGIADFLARHTYRSGGRLALTTVPHQADPALVACVFLDTATAQCRVHAAKPRQCATFPFWPAAIASPAGWAAHAARCPGMNQGTLVTEAELTARFQAGRGLPLYPPPALPLPH